MNRLVRAELLKLRTTQVWFWLLLAILALAVAAGIATPLSGEIQTPADVATMFANTNGGIYVTFILGILGITTEFRHQTFTPTVLATPSRWAIVTAKLLTYALVGAAFALLAIAVELAIAAPWLSSHGIELQLVGDVGNAMLGLVLVFVLFAVMGVGFGALLRNQALALSLGLVFLLVVNNLLGALPGVKALFAYLPEGAMLSALYQDGTHGPEGVTLLPAAGGVVVLLLWALMPAALGAAVTLNRDIT